MSKSASNFPQRWVIHNSYRESKGELQKNQDSNLKCFITFVDVLFIVTLLTLDTLTMDVTMS